MSADLTTARWRKFGKDRLYVSTPDGARVGWVDLLTGDEVVEQPALTGAFHAVVTTWTTQQGLSLRPTATSPAPPVPNPEAPVPLSATSGPAVPTRTILPAQRPVAEPAPAGIVEPVPAATVEPVAAAVVAAPEPVAPTWTDLAANVPGQAARQQAEAELAAQRQRSRTVSFLARVFDAKTDERAWRVGAGGEETVGARLDKLTKHGWHVLHAVPVGNRGSDIDHVVIGPGGVYTLNTKTHPGGTIWVGQHQVRVNGHRTDYLRNSRHEAARAERLLTEAVGFPVFVKAALVFLTGTLIPQVTIKQEPDDVLIYDRMDIPRLFKRAPERLAPQQVAEVFAHARRSITWRPRS